MQQTIAPAKAPYEGEDELAVLKRQMQMLQSAMAKHFS